MTYSPAMLLCDYEAMEHYMSLALEEAREAARLGEVPVGAVIVCDGSIVGRGHNLTQKLRDVTAHAEMQALTAASDTLGGKYLTDCTLFVTVEPCIMCAGALGWSQTGAIVYGTDDPRRGFKSWFCARPETPSPLHPRTLVRGGILEEECRNVMQEFFKMRRRKPGQ